MPLPEALRRAWQEAEYRVRLPHGGFAVIELGAPLPAALRAVLHVEAMPWGYITAWNPGGTRRPTLENRARQLHLRVALREGGYRVLAGAGVGHGGWREPSLFVPRIEPATLDALAREFGQLGVLRATPAGAAELHILL